MYFWGWPSGHVPQEGGWDTDVCRPSSIQPNSRISIEKTMVSFASQKNLAEGEFNKFTSMEKIPSTFFDQMSLAK